MSGPTLLYLSDNVGATVGQVSLTFTGRSIGQFIGSLAYGFIMNKFKNFKAFLACGKYLISNFNSISLFLPLYYHLERHEWSAVPISACLPWGHVTCFSNKCCSGGKSMPGLRADLFLHPSVNAEHKVEQALMYSSYRRFEKCYMYPVLPCAFSYWVNGCNRKFHALCCH